MDRIFGPNGLLGERLTSYEYRPEQRRMAEAVSLAFTRERFLIVEAGTGTGKTLAYLIPAVLSGRRVVVSTGTKTLQEQLFFRDIPFLQEKLGYRFRAVFMKGRNNYLCRRRFRIFSRQPLFTSIEEISFLPALRKWAAKTKTGDRAELEGLPEDLALWKEICSMTENCLGQACESFEECFITRLRQDAAGSDLIVVNHHLLFADLSVRLSGYGEVLPRYEAVIFDEAHQIEDVATQYFGAAVSNYRFEELARDIRREVGLAKLKDEVLFDIADRLEGGGGEFFNIFRAPESRYRLRRERFAKRIHTPARELMDRLGLLANHVAAMKDPPETVRNLGRRGEDLLAVFQKVIALEDKELVYWCENRGKGVFLHASPVDLSSELREHLYSRVRIAVFTSATLSTQGNFRFFQRRAGLEADAEELLLDSSFEMGRQALLFLPKPLPDPNQAVFLPRAAEEIEKIVLQTRGRAFLLFTSIRNMEEAYSILKDRLPFTCFLQGERPKTALIRAFKEDTHSVLFATASFWEGVDVQGESLSCVVVDRLPFSSPGEPVMEARLERIAAAGGSPFWEYQVPSAIILLKQGLGRLIRTQQDRGVLAILDPRLLTRGYGKAFLESLPACPIARDPAEIGKFFENPAGQGGVPDKYSLD